MCCVLWLAVQHVFWRANYISLNHLPLIYAHYDNIPLIYAHYDNIPSYIDYAHYDNIPSYIDISHSLFGGWSSPSGKLFFDGAVGEQVCGSDALDWDWSQSPSSW